MRKHVITAAALFVAVFLGGASAHGAADVAVVDLSFKGSIQDWMKKLLHGRLVKGLKATGATVVTDQGVRLVIKGSCDTDLCRAKLAARIGCRYLVGGTIKGEDRSYDINLWMARGDSGRVEARFDQRCEICGQEAVASKVELAASALRAKMEAATPAAASKALAKGLQRPLETDTPGRGQPWQVIAGWTGLAVGVVALGAGVALLAMDGGMVDCTGQQVIPGGQCPRQYETATIGGVLLGVGAGALATGGLLAYLGYRKPEPPAVSLRITGAGAVLSGTF